MAKRKQLPPPTESELDEQRREFEAVFPDMAEVKTRTITHDQLVAQISAFSNRLFAAETASFEEQWDAIDRRAALAKQALLVKRDRAGK